MKSQDKIEKIFDKREKLLNVILILFIILGVFLFQNFKFSNEFYNACFWVISFNIALLLVLAVKDIPKKLKKYEEEGRKKVIALRDKSVKTEISLLKLKKIKEAKKEFTNQLDIYNIISITENKFILNIILSISLAIFYVSFYFLSKNLDLINKIVFVRILEMNIAFADLILIICFFSSLYYFLKSLFHITYIFMDYKKE